MKEICLIDGDIIGYRIGFTTEDVETDIVKVRVDELIRRIVNDTASSSYRVFLSGTGNFRYSLYSHYKANRKGKPKPRHLEWIRQYLCMDHSGFICSGWEADDELCMEQHRRGTTSIIASIDKDLLQVPGFHYDFVKGIERFISPLDGLRRLYSQAITGDGADNIPSFDGKVRNTVPQFIERLLLPLQDMTTEEEMYSWCLRVYEDCGVNDQEQLDIHLQLLYLLKEENKHWQRPVGPKLDEEPS